MKKDNDKSGWAEWLAIGLVGALILNDISNSKKERAQQAAEEREYEERRKQVEEKRHQYEEERYLRELESQRKKDIEVERKKLICKFKDGISYDDFSSIVYMCAYSIKRIKNVVIRNAVVFCTVESQTGFSDWNFRLDFNNWGHITGTYWRHTENYDSSIPKHLGNMISGKIHQLYYDKNIYLPDFSDYIDENNTIGTPDGLSFSKREGFFKKRFTHKIQITSQYNSLDLLGEHIYLVISLLKNNGFQNIKSIPIKDVTTDTTDSDKYIFEVEQIVINGISFFEEGDSFSENAEVIITYHSKLEITMPFSMNFFKKKNYIDVGDQLLNMGFTNIYEKKIRDLVTGLITKEGSVEQVLVKNETEVIPIIKNQLYEYDTEITITYHTFK